MKKKMLHPSLTLGSRKPYLDKTEEALARIDIILNTRPGDLPWNPDFGCDLTELVGESATPERVNFTKSQVERALGKWLPNASVENCELQLVTGEGQVIQHREPNVPTAEAALVSMGTEARLELKLDIEVEEQLLELGSEIEL